MSQAARRAAIVAAARGWIGTPYQHQASLKGVGCDCLGLVRGVWREAVGPEPAEPPPYRPDWAEASGEESLLLAARRYLVLISYRAAHQPSPSRGGPSGRAASDRGGRRGAENDRVPTGPLPIGPSTSFGPPSPHGERDSFCLEHGFSTAPESGDILLFRWRAHLPAKHCAILTGPATMIHAHDGAAVAEVAFTPWWGRHLAGVFRFPDSLTGSSQCPHPEVPRAAGPRRTQHGGACFEARLRRAPQHEENSGSSAGSEEMR